MHFLVYIGKKKFSVRVVSQIENFISDSKIRKLHSNHDRQKEQVFEEVSHYNEPKMNNTCENRNSGILLRETFSINYENYDY